MLSDCVRGRVPNCIRVCRGKRRVMKFRTYNMPTANKEMTAHFKLSLI